MRKSRHVVGWWVSFISFAVTAAALVFSRIHVAYQATPSLWPYVAVILVSVASLAYFDSRPTGRRRKVDPNDLLELTRDLSTSAPNGSWLYYAPSRMSPDRLSASRRPDLFPQVAPPEGPRAFNLHRAH